MDMTVYDIPNITVEEMGNPVLFYRIRAVSGYVLKLPTYEELEYKTVAVLQPTYDFSLVRVIAESDLPEGAYINGVGDNNDHEIM